MSDGLTLDAWRSLLQARGHRVTEPDRETMTGFSLWPAAEMIITVAVDPDGTLYPQYRERFFLCDPEAQQVFRVVGCPEAHRGRWLGLVSRQPPGYWQDFLAGPGSWLLSRLARFRRVVAWADRGLSWDGLDFPLHRDWGMDVPVAAAPFFPATAGPEAALPRLLPVGDLRFADVVAACVLFGSVGMRDCYLADEAGTEVYLAHHHDKVVVSIPNVGARKELLRELEEARWLFTDVSGYGSTLDEDQDEDSLEDADP